MPAPPIRFDEISSIDWQLALGELGQVVEGIAEVDQCIRVILLTPRGSVPLHPEFGSDIWRYLDWPANRARPLVIREVLDSVAAFEPRVEVTAVEVGQSESGAGLVIRLGRRLKSGVGVPTASDTVVVEVA